MTEAPSSRYKVVERGRRLVVIDTRTGREATAAPPPDRTSASDKRGSAEGLDPVDRMLGRVAGAVINAAPRSVDDRSGRPILKTSPLYDLKGPRRVILDENTQRAFAGVVIVTLVIGFVLLSVAVEWPAILIVPALVLINGTRPIRRWITARIDALDQAAD
ncbi:hypothetical protein LZK98_01460 [Sphingomonas cannabina]|uniref:hypothetical protein n=1 Tax=Sphingomonas cannabina TaxID=2899123 RepID=UPI001F290CE8|nr:hypothetical protein [Sphingomonas cannabina]UIJ45658.1 hypothetical protein LZK98_01460 [Sphingomonas cannabina]